MAIADKQELEIDVTVEAFFQSRQSLDKNRRGGVFQAKKQAQFGHGNDQVRSDAPRCARRASLGLGQSLVVR
ncbi:hypothetical protein N788_01760 [Arenimonas donghaensis DSM 18148 = HO3-R19]|uniref:Uncharacterized protein n=1 Tax=Arenimonas donghaensis DSM 18148 = HO3-R19 TaxID=1121014 RepID=A0A087MM20_9GAMM|nr:hypothetical protein N788_01760 [Arenimonas donghaensis DSM 18148 = HO3-R19]